MTFYPIKSWISCNIIENDLSLPIFFGHNRQARVMYNHLLTDVNTYFNKNVNKMSNTSSKQRKPTLKQTISELKKLTAEADMVRKDELDVDYLDEVEFMLESKGRWLLCHIKKDYPYIIRFRLIGDRNYERVKPQNFIEAAKKSLLH